MVSEYPYCPIHGEPIEPPHQNCSKCRHNIYRGQLLAAAASEAENRPLLVGTMLYGFCNGFFGRDSYEDKRVEAVGADWVVCRDESGDIHFAYSHNGWDVHEVLSEHTVKEEDPYA